MSDELSKFGRVEIVVIANGYMLVTQQGQEEAFIRNAPVSNNGSYVFEEFPALSEFLRTRLRLPKEKQ